MKNLNTFAFLALFVSFDFAKSFTEKLKPYGATLNISHPAVGVLTNENESLPNLEMELLSMSDWTIEVLDACGLPVYTDSVKDVTYGLRILDLQIRNIDDVYRFVIDAGFGIHAPQTFVERHNDELKKAITQGYRPYWSYFVDVLKGPDHDNYWESWDYITQNTRLKVDGIPFTITQDEDIYLVRADITDVESKLLFLV